MSSLFQSEEMSLCQLFLQTEVAYACVNELGELGLAQFIDLNPGVSAFQRKYVNEVRRCDEMERKLRYLEKEIKKDGIPMLDTGENPEAPQPREMIDLEAKFEKLENDLREVNDNSVALKRNYLDLVQLKQILRKIQAFFDEREGEETLNSSVISDQSSKVISEDVAFSGSLEPGPGANAPMKLGFLAGVIPREKMPGFERLLWRACRGNLLLRQSEIDTPLDDPVTGDPVNKCVFIIFYQGEQLKSRVMKICEGYHATVYPCSETPAERREMSIKIMSRIEDLKTVLDQTEDHRHRILVSAAKSIKPWFVKVRKIKAIYATLNLFSENVTQKCLIAECWLPVQDFKNIQSVLQRATERSGSTVPPILHKMKTDDNPPTFNRLNKFTRGFQNLVDAYGVASYREVNPAPYTCITFPFLFAVMFGDAGHACLMIAFAGWMVFKEKSLMNSKNNNEIWKIFFGGRYIILLMGLFSFYTGLIYNDVFSKSLNLFGSNWYINNKTYPASLIANEKSMMLDPKTSTYDYPYPFGLDPVWQLADNKIAFLNGYKMKISIIIGVVHMLFGVLLSIWNHVFFKRFINIFCEFIPQILFMVLLFLYLCILVFHKWLWYGARIPGSNSEHCAPSILITFINMVLFKFEKEEEGQICSPYMFPYQKWLQLAFVVVAFVCIPWMLLIKPIMLNMRHKKELRKKEGNGATSVIIGSDLESGLSGPTSDVGLTSGQEDRENGSAIEDAAPEGSTNKKHEEEFELSEIFIHQGIHTIEYVLGSVSHTASYLRLWALSLAHAQLSEVLWSMVMRIGLAQTKWYGGIVLWAIFAFWAVLTLSILVLMEGLSAFLHTLRLHWVEFQSKFYEGQGYAFAPFSFKEILSAEEGED